MGPSKKAESSKRHSKAGRTAEREEEASAQPEQLYGDGLQRGRRRRDSRRPRTVAAASSSPPQRSSASPPSSPPQRSVSPGHPPPEPSSPPRGSSSVRSHPAQPSAPRSSSPLRCARLRSSSSVGSSQAGSSPHHLHHLENDDEVRVHSLARIRFGVGGERECMWQTIFFD